MLNYVQLLPSTVSVALAETVPAVFLAVQLYTPMSSGLTSIMKNTSSSGMTCIRRSRAAGKSVPPSFCQAICGAGWPSAAHSSLAVWPVLMVLSLGVFTKDGRTVGGRGTVNLVMSECWRSNQNARLHGANNSPQSKDEARGLTQTQTLNKYSTFAGYRSDRAQKRWPLLALTCS